jgi:hypothetical protein
MKKHLLFILALLLFAPAAFAQKNSFSISVDKEKILIGEPFNVTLQAAFPKGRSINWFRIDTIPHFEILTKSKIDTQATGNELTLKQTISFTSWDSGRWQMPAFTLAGYKTTSKAIMIAVGYSAFDRNQDYHDIKDILEIKKPAKVTWYWYVIGAALLLLLLILLFPKRKKQKATEVISNVDAYKLAMTKLDALKGKEEGEAKLFYTELIDIFRTYVQQRKGIHSFQKTTDDLSVQLRSLQLPSEEYNALVQVLRLSDVVKFARFTPASTENNAALNQIKKSIMTIENTK